MTLFSIMPKAFLIVPPLFGNSFVKLRPEGKMQRLHHPWCRHPAFARRMVNLRNAANLGALAVPDRSILSKTFMRDAALHARDSMFLAHPNGRLRLSSIAKTVWSSDDKLLKVLICSARKHLFLVGGVPSLRDPTAFEEEFRIAHPDVGAEFMKKWWSLSPKVASAALAHHGEGPFKGQPLTLNQC